jgi:hypothetical protein
MDDSIQKAIRIGKRNKEIIELAQNWCGHLEVRQSGCVGLVEIETGLPIGMRSFQCPYASAAGLAGMNLEVVALDFYDRNCVGCKDRLPVRFPNLCLANCYFAVDSLGFPALLPFCVALRFFHSSVPCPACSRLAAYVPLLGSHSLRTNF